MTDLQHIEINGQSATVAFMTSFDGELVDSQDANVAIVRFKNGQIAYYELDNLKTAGGPGSGHHGHEGRPGEVGGSAPEGSGGKAEKKARVYFGTGSTYKGKVMGMEPQKFADHMTSGLKNDEVELALEGDADAISVHVTGKSGGELEFFADITVRDKVMEFDSINTLPSIRNTDTAMRMIDNTITTGIEGGIDEVRFNANLDLGAYAWARIGAQASDPEKLAVRVNNRLRTAMTQATEGPIEALNKLGGDTLRQLQSFVRENKSSPLLPRKLAELKVGGKNIGRFLLRGLSWDGSFNLKDQEAIARFKRFAPR